MGNEKYDEINIDFVDIFKYVWKHIKLLLQITFSAVLITFIISEFVIPKQYSAQAIILPNNGMSLQVNLDTINSERLWERIISKAHLEEDVDSLKNKVVITSNSTSNEIYITVTDSNSEGALKIVNEIVKYTPDILKEVLGNGTIIVVQDAYTSGKTIYPNVKKYVINVSTFVFLLMLLILIIAGCLKNYYSSSEDVENDLKVPILGSVSLMDGRKVNHIIQNKNSNTDFTNIHVTEECNDIAQKIIQYNDKIILWITAPTELEEHSFFSMQIVKSLSKMGKRVLLLDGNLYNGFLDLLTGVSTLHLGLSSILSGQCKLEDAIIKLDNGIDFIPAGIVGRSQANMMNSFEMASTLSRLHKMYDCLIIDGAPLNLCTDEMSALRFSDKTILVVSYNNTIRANAKTAIDDLKKMNIKNVGVVMGKYYDSAIEKK